MTRLRALASGFLIGVATSILMLATEPCLAIAWDEGFTLGRVERLRLWVQALRDPGAFAASWRRPSQAEELLMPDQSSPPFRHQVDTRLELLFDRPVIEWFWPFAREEPHGHPPFYALVALAGDWLTPSRNELARARLCPILLFSLTAGAICAFTGIRWGPWPALAATSAWLFQPNLFGLSHYATYDGILTSLWVIAILIVAAGAARTAQPGSCPSAKTSWLGVPLGITLGCAAATKLTGWFLPIPFLIWAALRRDRRAFVTICVGLLVAAVVTFVLVPPWWTAPIDGVVRFLRSNATRGESIPIPVSFLHRVYDTPNESLPWYNTLLWTAIVTPLGFLGLAGAGLCAGLRDRGNEPVGLLLAVHWAFLIVLRALPHAPGHDGVRLFLPAFGVLALLCGLGARFLIDRGRPWAKAAIVAATVEGAVSVGVMMPVPLSYFSPLAGGLPGAAALGFEPTYYWDALSPDARRWLVRNTPPGRTIVFRSFAHSFLYLRRTGDLPPRLAGVDRGEPLWYVLQNRPGAFREVDRLLIARGQPAYVVTKLAVPLVWIVPYRELHAMGLAGAG
jgi:hypothetical protein